MRVRLLELAVLGLHLCNVFGSTANQVGAWVRQAANEASPIPQSQSDPAYDYTAVKFASSEEGPHIDKLAMRYAGITGWEHVGQLGSLPKYRVFRRHKARLANRGAESDAWLQQKAGDAVGVESMVLLGQKRRPLFKRALVDDVPEPAGFGDRQTNKTDTEWHDIADPLYEKQWHLVNTDQVGHDINITGVWRQGITGAGVTVALIDDGLDYSSDDLLGNFDFHGSYDFNDKTKLPTPRLEDDYHGTRCAGQIAAARNNVCGVGVAYGARVSGIRLLSKEVTDQDELLAINYGMDRNWIYSCSWGPSDDGRTVQGPDKLIEDAFINGVENGRGGLGSIYVFATGNGASSGDNCNMDGYTNSIYTISIGAIDHHDQHPYYSEQCSAQLAVTYSNGAGRGIVTTDLGLRRCTNKHGGTSAAAPLGAGIFSLVLSVRPDLTWRDVQHLAVRTAIPVDLVDSDWTEVAEGRKYNHKYGFGKMDAWRIVESAKTFEKMGKQAKIDMPVDTADEKLPPLEKVNGESKSVERSVEVTREQVADAKMKRVEHVTVVIDMEHEFRGNVEIWLESPHGYRSQLAAVRQRDSSKEGLKGWKFMSVKHWDEDPVGRWTLQVRNAYQPRHSGKLRSWKLTVYGESTEPEPYRDVPQLGGNVTIEPQQPTPPVDESAGEGRVDEQPSTNDDSSRRVGRGTAAVLSGAFFVSGIITAVLAMLLYMRRRERKLGSMRWTPLNSMGGQGDEEEVIFSSGQPHHSSGRQAAPNPHAEDDDMDDVFEYVDVTAGVSESSIRASKPFRDTTGPSDEDDDRTRASPSSPSGEGTHENERLV
ncbi:pheromone processing endoprotease [Coemansia sp. RSA 552]|nr:pheromone processing endoprotease [Coemansia sp. RSA 552]